MFLNHKQKMCVDVGGGVLGRGSVNCLHGNCLLFIYTIDIYTIIVTSKSLNMSTLKS